MLRRISWKAVIKNLFVLGLLCLIILVFSSVSVTFISWPNIVNILRQAVPAMLVGGSVTLLMISGHIDLSVGGIVGLTSVIYALLLKAGLGYVSASMLTLALGVAMGYLNGLLVVKLRIVPVIATLATMSLFIGFGKLLSPTGIGLIKGLPDDVSKFGRSAFLFDLPLAFYITVIIIAILVVIQRKTILGKYAAAIGGNRVAAELSGINAAQNIWLLYMIVALCSALGGIARTSLLSLGDPTAGMNMELDAIIAVVLGGTTFTGGEGSVLRTMVGVLIIACLTSGMQVVGMPPYWQSLVKGAVLIFAVVVNSLIKEKVDDSGEFAVPVKIQVSPNKGA